MDKKVTPYEVVGKVDYDRLIKEFGTSLISPELLKKIKVKDPLIGRGHFYGHRDLEKILSSKKFAIVSGRGPSEKMTLGHLAIFNFVKKMQDAYGCYVFIPFSDDEKFMIKQNLSFEEAQKYAYENAVDIASLGLNPKKTEFLFDTTTLNQDLYNLAIKCAKKMTFSMIKDSMGFSESTNIGSIFYPAMQAAHILYPTVKYKLPVLVLIAIDQDVMVRLARDVATKLGIEKPAALLSKFIPGLNGEDKMSSSNPQSALYMNDSAKEVETKIRNAFSGGRDTLEEHRRLGGNPDIDPIFQYLKLFLVQDDKEIEDIEIKFRTGKLSSGELKQIGIEKINTFLKGHNEMKRKVKDMIKKFIKS